MAAALLTLYGLGFGGRGRVDVVVDMPIRVRRLEPGEAPTCENLCFADEQRRLPDGAVCACDAASCGGRDGAEAVGCCRGFEAHCRASAAAPVTIARWQPNAHVAPRAFPPASFGPSRHFLDVAAAYKGGAEGVPALVAWLRWMRFAGVGHFTLYSLAGRGLEQHAALVPYAREGYLVHRTLQSTAADIAAAAFAHAKAGDAEWRAFMAVGEFPIAQGDAAAGFLARQLARVSTAVGLVYVQQLGASGAERYVLRSSSASGFGERRGGTLGSVAHPPPTALAFELHLSAARAAAVNAQDAAGRLFAGVPAASASVGSVDETRFNVWPPSQGQRA